jgi:hypothetical protein
VGRGGSMKKIKKVNVVEIFYIQVWIMEHWNLLKSP